jgi:hypothetical protein
MKRERSWAVFLTVLLFIVAVGLNLTAYRDSA